MPQSKEERRPTSVQHDSRRRGGDLFDAGMAPLMFNPVMTIFAEFTARMLEGLAAAQKDWAVFVQRRIKEDVDTSRELMSCQSPADMHQVYARYFQTAFEQYREQSEQVIQRSSDMAQQFAETTEREAARTRH